MPQSEEMKVKICLVGESGVGKTSLVRRFVFDEFDDRHIATLGAKVSKKEIVVRVTEVKRIDVNMTIWDIMGEGSFRDIMKEAFFYGAQGILAVCDVTRRDTLNELHEWVKAVHKVAGDVPVYFLANKIDLEEQISFEETELRQVAETYNSPYSYTSALTGENVQEAFQHLAELIYQMSAPVP